MQTLTLSQDSAQLPGTNTSYLEAMGGTGCTGGLLVPDPIVDPEEGIPTLAVMYQVGVTVQDTQWDLISL